MKRRVKVPEVSADEYVRVGDDYYKLITKVKADMTIFRDWYKTSRQTILDDNDKYFLRSIPKYDGFCNVPNHKKHDDVIHSNFNKYYPFTHKKKKGSVKWTMRLLRHIFGDQIEIGLDYIQLLYEKPTQILPILCLVSYENQTGKTTFLNWLNVLFKNNATIIGNQDLQSQFNVHYATKLLVMVDESKIDKQHVLEKIKSMATSDTINVNSKFITPYSVDFFGKIIMCSNYEDNFITAKEEDIRYWVRKIGKPKFKNHLIKDDLLKEMPAFLFYLSKRSMNRKMESRMWFDPDDLFTDALREIKANSTETVIKHLMEFLTDKYDETEEEELFATPTDISDIVFKNNNRIDPSYIRRLLKTKFGLNPNEKNVRYSPLEAEYYDYEVKKMLKMTKTGRPFGLKRDVFYLNGAVFGINGIQKTTDEIVSEIVKVADIQIDNNKIPF